VPSCVPPACACVFLKSTRAFLNCPASCRETRQEGAVVPCLFFSPCCLQRQPRRRAPVLREQLPQPWQQSSSCCTTASEQCACRHILQPWRLVKEVNTISPLPSPCPFFASADCSSLTGGKRPRADWWLTTCKRSILYIRETSLRQCKDSPHGVADRRHGVAEQPGHTLPETPFTLPRCTPAGQKMGALPAR